ncbi:MAG: protein kinase family protein, partial [Actinomycetota bacterium]
MTAQAVRPGRLLAGRYRVEDLLDEVDGVRSWRGVDEVLRRAVFVHTLATDDPRATALTQAAQAASQVGDTRFLQVLDVDSEEDTVYVIREWITGQNLKLVLAAGPLPPDQAAALGGEVAEALASAHQQGLTHLRLEPSSVLISDDGTVKVAGLATEAALHGAVDGDPGEVDAAGIGRILYAALTGRWPDGDGHGLPAAPRIDGRIASPRQVRPGVPRILDEVVDRTLGNSARHNARSLRSPAEVADALNSGTTSGRASVVGETTDSAGPPPAVLQEQSAPNLLAAPAAVPPGIERSPGSQVAARVIGVVVAATFLGVAAWLGWQGVFGGVSGDEGSVAVSSPEPDETTTTDEQTPTPTSESTPTGEETEQEADEESQEPEISLDAEPTSVAPSQRITLSGRIEPAVEGVELGVERQLNDGEWQSFPDDSGQITTQ